MSQASHFRIASAGYTKIRRLFVITQKSLSYEITLNRLVSITRFSSVVSTANRLSWFRGLARYKAGVAGHKGLELRKPQRRKRETAK